MIPQRLPSPINRIFHRISTGSLIKNKQDFSSDINWISYLKSSGFLGRQNDPWRKDLSFKNQLSFSKDIENGSTKAHLTHQQDFSQKINRIFHLKSTGILIWNLDPTEAVPPSVVHKESIIGAEFAIKLPHPELCFAEFLWSGSRIHGKDS